jgi:hypothetical protein
LAVTFRPSDNASTVAAKWRSAAGMRACFTLLRTAGSLRLAIRGTSPAIGTARFGDATGPHLAARLA